jgi:predicted AAA+ superfamily ATPase
MSLKQGDIMIQAILQVLLEEFHTKLSLLKDLVPREAAFAEAPNKIKVAIGMRRAGKTYFVYQHILHLIKEGIDKNQILYLNFEDDRLRTFDRGSLAKLVEAFYSLYPENHEKRCYLFLDEIQNVEEWPQVVRRFHDTKNVEIFLTGSSAKLLSKEIATSLRGRSLATEIWPYSFKEFIKAQKLTIDTSLYGKKTQDTLMKAFQLYLSTGGFPEVTFYPVDVRQQTLQEYIDLVIYRDIVERHRISNPALIKHMILSMLHNTGRPFSVHKFYNESKSLGYAISKDVLYDYSDYIEDAYLTFSIPIFDSSVRKVQANPKKLYAIDPGLVRALTWDYDRDLGRLFENVVYLDLRRHRCHVSYYLTKDRREVDFIIQTPRGQKKFFQVVWNMEDPATCERETRALETAMKELKIPGEILTLNAYLQKGIIV